ncbi:hypothetical protein CHU93_01645 [Sandarakinorhabdus cyanobacteriorum]|uniref:Uncharacterized protein n=1 Tax=Sandarakinorhabdus cyanobacteriorum TaxID=1981098 RepID=A0A255Z3C7_9SPHN|nr:hypothetical protein [Sandarakinorhabdus cyanobacteriorum]OYQ35434.1 hypothetical protein CHU93_01645 [Sandarakinorhabdus cyanobacteriorum]
MLKERRIAANKIAEQLFAAEAAIDAAVAAVAQLTTVMPMARQEAHLSACIGQDALMNAVQTCQQLVEARARIIATHASLRQAQTQVGLDAVNFNGRCPPEEGALTETAAPARRLTIAA